MLNVKNYKSETLNIDAHFASYLFHDITDQFIVKQLEIGLTKKIIQKVTFQSLRYWIAISQI